MLLAPFLAMLLLAAAEPPVTAPATVVLFAEAPIEFDADLTDGNAIGQCTRRGHGQTVEATASLSQAPVDQRQATRILATVTIRPARVKAAKGETDRQAVPSDAWTRAGSLSVVVPGDGAGPDQEVELMRFVTGFGGPGSFKQDLTSLSPLLHGKRTFRLHLSTYSNPGWIAGATLEYCAQGAGYRRPVFAQFLFNDPHVTAKQPRLRATVDIPAGLGRPRLRILSTGHATDGGPENEFITCPNILLVDGREVAQWRPWAEQGGSVRELNPMAGQQIIDGRELWSSDLDRSGWHPGLVVEPQMVPLPELTEGRHDIELEIRGIRPQGADHAHGYWRVSAVVVADEPWPAAAPGR